MTDSTRRARRTFTEDFKKQMVLLHQNGRFLHNSLIRMYICNPLFLLNF